MVERVSERKREIERQGESGRQRPLARFPCSQSEWERSQQSRIKWGSRRVFMNSSWFSQPNLVELLRTRQLYLARFGLVHTEFQTKPANWSSSTSIQYTLMHRDGLDQFGRHWYFTLEWCERCCFLYFLFSFTSYDPKLVHAKPTDAIHQII